MSSRGAAETNLTRRQLFVWLDHQLDPTLRANDTFALVRISAEVDVGRFGRAFDSVVRRSDALRTTFHEVDGCPRQEVAPAIEFELDVADLSSERDPEARLADWLVERRRAPWQLDRRAFDAALVRLGPNLFVWYLCQHHLIADAWSFSLVFRRTSEAYTTGAQPDLPPFARYLEYENAYRTSPAYAAAETYWTHKLAEPIEPLAVQSVLAPPVLDRRSVVLTDGQTEALRRSAKIHAHRGFAQAMSEMSIFMAALMAHVHRSTGRARVAIGAPVVNRPSKTFRETVGRFAEVASFRVKIDDHDTFVSLLEKVSREMFETFVHAQQSNANPVHRRTFDVLLNFHNATFPRFDGSPTETQLWTGLASIAGAGTGDVKKIAAHEKLVVSVHDFDEAGRPSVTFDFDRASFEPNRQEEVVIEFMRLLEAIFDAPGRAVRDVEMCSSFDRADVDLADPSGDERPAKRTKGSPRRFEPPENDLELEIATIWQETTGGERIGRRDDFFQIGGDSLLALDLVRRMNRAFGDKVTLGLLFETPTVAGLAAALSKGRKARPAVIPLQSRGSTPPLFFVCGIQIYHQLAQRIGPSQPSYGIFLPVEEQMLYTRDAARHGQLITVERMAQSYLELIRAKQPRGPYCLAGLSFGGLLAFEIAQQLRDRGEEIALLALFDSILPRARKRKLVPWLAHRLGALARFDLSAMRRGPLPSSRPSDSGIVPARPMSSDEDFARIRAAIYARAAAAYEARIRPFAGRVTYFRASERHCAPGWVLDERGGWADVVTGGLEIVDIPGDHVGILRHPGVELLAGKLRADLVRIWRRRD
jgi:thioesterase domain-containing protein